VEVKMVIMKEISMETKMVKILVNSTVIRMV